MSLFSIVRRLREQRYALVQMEEQYEFMYKFMSKYAGEHKFI